MKNKGSEIAIEEKLTSRSWEDKEGNKRYTTEVVINELLLMNNRSSAENSSEKTEDDLPFLIKRNFLSIIKAIPISRNGFFFGVV